MAVPLAGKLSAPRQIHWMTEMTMSLSKKVLTEGSSDASVLSSVIGSYDDCNITVGSASFIQQGSNDQSSLALHHSSNLFTTLLHLMEPYHVSTYRCVRRSVCPSLCICMCQHQFYETLKSDNPKPCNWDCCQGQLVHTYCISGIVRERKCLWISQTLGAFTFSCIIYS